MKWNMAVQKLCYKSKGYLHRNAPTILTVAGAVGLVATTVTAIKVTPKVVKLLEASEAEKGSELTKRDVVEVAWVHYIPTVVLGTASIACIFGANVLNKRQQASLISAYTLLDTSYKAHKAKVEELYGESANMRVREEVAKDQYAEEEPEFEYEDDKILFYDNFSQRYFESTMADVIKAEYELNRRMAVNSGAYLNEFYEFLDIPTIPAGQELGWSSGILESHYWANWIEFDHEKVVMDDGLECYIISMRYEPVIDFAYY